MRPHLGAASYRGPGVDHGAFTDAGAMDAHDIDVVATGRKFRSDIDQAIEICSRRAEVAAARENLDIKTSRRHDVRDQVGQGLTEP